MLTIIVTRLRNRKKTVSFSRWETGWETGNGFLSLKNSLFPFPVSCSSKKPVSHSKPVFVTGKNTFLVLISILFNSISRFKNRKNYRLKFPVYLKISFYFIFNVKL